MSLQDDTWSQVHDLALVYLALAYGADNELTDAELETLAQTLEGWREDLSREQVQEIVLEAMTVYLEDGAPREVARSIDALKDTLDDEERRRALEGVVRIAEADGVLLTSEQSLISVVAGTWGIKPLADDLIASSTAIVEARPSWSLLHDIALMYVVLAHSTDNDLSEAEIAAILARLTDWQPTLDPEHVRHVLRQSLNVYAGEPVHEALTHSVKSIKDNLPPVQRLALLDDLLYIAEIDGHINDHEREMIATLADAWQVRIHVNLNGQAQPIAGAS